MVDPQVRILTGKDITADEIASLLAAVGWGARSDYSAATISRSLAAYPFVAFARDSEDALVGYLTAFSDGAFSTFVGELVIHPRVQRQGVGRRLLQAVETYSNGVPIYLTPFADQEEIFISLGYRRPPRRMSVLFRRTEQVAGRP